MPKGNPNPSPETRLQPGHTLSRKHGGEAAIKALQKGEPLTGPARQAELAVHAELETQGRYHLVRRTAARLQATCDLFWSAVSKAAEDQNLEALDRYIKRFGWLAGASLRAWAQVKEEEPTAGQLADYEVLLREEDD